ncbi:MAG: hypothetical protein AAF715_02160 [Myxococcota bacterium]
MTAGPFVVALCALVAPGDASCPSVPLPTARVLATGVGGGAATEVEAARGPSKRRIRPSEPPSSDAEAEDGDEEDAPPDDGGGSASEGAPSDEGEEGSSATPKKPPPARRDARPPTVAITDLAFVGGEVPLASRFLARAHPAVARCIHEHGGLTAAEGLVSMQMLVRSRGRAEGVEVLARRHVSEAAGGCVRRVLKGRWMGVPSQDPVGVTFRLRFRRGGS